MAEFINGLKRTNMCGDLTAKDEGKNVVVMGFAAKVRNLGNLIFIDLRDRTGLVQIAFDGSKNADLFEKAEAVGNEYVLAVAGVVQLRTGKNVNPNMKTGEVEILATDVRILNEAENPPFFIQDDVNTRESLRLQYRYLDLRRPYLQNLLMLRSQIAHVTRNYLAENGFWKSKLRASANLLRKARGTISFLAACTRARSMRFRKARSFTNSFLWWRVTTVIIRLRVASATRI